MEGNNGLSCHYISICTYGLQKTYDEYFNKLKTDLKKKKKKMTDLPYFSSAHYVNTTIDCFSLNVYLLNHATHGNCYFNLKISSMC